MRFKSMESIGDLINEQKWLKPVETVLDATAEVTLNQKNPVAQQVRNVLHGTWLGHPLHPLLTDVPLGAWSASTMLDLYELSTGDETFSPGADAAVGIGLIGAAGAAVAGLNDWQFANSGDPGVGNKPKRVGALHAILNIGATLCYLGSWLQRRNGRRREGIVTGLAGFCLSMAGAYLGGHLVFKEQIGVNHAPQGLPSKFAPVMDGDDLPEGKLKKADMNGIPIVLVRRNGEIFGLADKCAHMGGPLSEGKLEGMCVRCPWHGSLFAFDDGRAIEGPTAFPQPCLEARERAGKIEVRERRFA
jgi:nitrite reductase/ring-hydroxylating ferredoxin subunit/uncharacterized membrane protein